MTQRVHAIYSFVHSSVHQQVFTGPYPVQGIGDTAVVENGSALSSQNIILVEEKDPSVLLQMKEGGWEGK